MTLYPLTEQQEEFLNSLTCERLHSNSVNRKMISFFDSEDGRSLVYALHQGWWDDQNGETAYYVIKDSRNLILLYFSLRCGSLHQPDSYQYFQAEFKRYSALYNAARGLKSARKWALAEIAKDTNGCGASPRMIEDLRRKRDRAKAMLKALKEDAKDDPTQMAVQTQQNFSGVEMVHFCANDLTSEIWDDSCAGGRALGETMFWRFILPVIQNVSKLVGCKYVYLFAAEKEGKPKLIKYYKEKLHFDIPEAVILRKPAYDVGCEAMCQELSALERYQKDYFDNYNRPELQREKK